MNRASVIRTPDQRLRVFVSSTLKELATERRAAREAIERLALAPVMFELGARPHPPRSLYRAYLAQSDIFVGVYWEQYGWIAPGEEVSGLEDEWNLAPGIPKLIYVKRSEHRQERLNELLARIRDNDDVSYVAFTDAAELADLVTADLATLLAEGFEATDARRLGPLVEVPAEVASTEVIGLPSPVTRMLGREVELDTAIRMLVIEGARLVTITGPGGIGKSRLAIAAARAVEASFPGGTAFVDLAPVEDPGMVIPAVAHALGIRDTGDRPLDETVRGALADCRMLLVLDNVEQVIESAPRISALLLGSSVTVLATSRILLRVSGEQSIDLGPLPDAAAAALFVERARAVKPAFEQTEDNPEVIQAISAALDATPLAIELAAARVRVFPPAEILARLDHALPLLVGGPRDLPERQRSMRATIEWSTQLLRDDQRELLLRLGVFGGGFAIDAVEWMAEELENADADDALGAFVDDSLVQERDRGSRAWFSLLAAVREFAREQLEARGETLECEERHARFYLRLAAEAAEPLTHASQSEWMSRLADERDGLRAAVAHFTSTRQWNEIVDLIWPLMPFWWIGGQLNECASWTRRLLDPDVELSRHSRTIVQFLTTSIAAQRMPDPKYIPALADCVERFQRDGDKLGEGLALAALAAARFLQPQPDLDDAEETIKRSVNLMEQANNPFMRVTMGLLLGQTELMRGHIPTAIQHFESNLALARTNGDRVSESGALNYLGWTRLLIGDFINARASFAETLLLTSATGNEWGTAYALEGLSAVAAGPGDLVFAGRMLGAAETIRERKGMFPASTDSFFQPILARILEAPDAEQFTTARTVGRETELADIVEIALAWTVPSVDPAQSRTEANATSATPSVLPRSLS
jgi:predicted ATPase